MIVEQKLKDIQARAAEIEAQMNSGTVSGDELTKLSKEYSRLNEILPMINEYFHTVAGIKDAEEMMGCRILFFCGGETFLWRDGEKSVRDLVIEAKQMGFLIVNVVTNGTFTLDLPEADLILLSLDGDRERHNLIRGETYDTIMKNIRSAASDNIVLYMAINKLNVSTVQDVIKTAETERNIRAVSFNFHTPYPDTADLMLSLDEKQQCASVIRDAMKKGSPIFNLKSALPYLVNNSFPTPCHQCVVIENGTISTCGRCIEIPGLCEQCGYFFVAEYTLLFRGNLRIMFDMLKTYLRYI